MPTTTSADGTRIEYDQTGSGPVVVLICAGPTDRNSNAELAGLLSSSCTVVNYDRRGRGGSGDVQPYNPDREVEDLTAVIDAAGGQAGVFGNSGGVFVAFRAAAAGVPFQRLALWEPPYAASGGGPAVPADYAEQQAELAKAGKYGAMAELFLTVAAGIPAEFVAGLRQGPAWGFLEAAASPALVYDAQLAGDFTIPADQAAMVSCPTLVLDGGTTPWLSSAADQVADSVADGTRATLAGQQHNVEATVLAPALAEFFTR
ncbi:alpha/beta fold hydrolase [Nocardioides speluncae]|uniref:alpha/beta fold hydrolase n=1 Tax=Nocardioides speluncae TaxID=2670337 RepID=UPI000D69B6D7|nr:alpha/beta hydrolase [Nocardioides speluncae]